MGGIRLFKESKISVKNLANLASANVDNEQKFSLQSQNL